LSTLRQPDGTTVFSSFVSTVEATFGEADMSTKHDANISTDFAADKCSDPSTNGFAVQTTELAA
jgi:hypothetical protein